MALQLWNLCVHVVIIVSKLFSDEIATEQAEQFYSIDCSRTATKVKPQANKKVYLFTWPSLMFSLLLASLKGTIDLHSDSPSARMWVYLDELQTEFAFCSALLIFMAWWLSDLDNFITVTSFRTFSWVTDQVYIWFCSTDFWWNYEPLTFALP